MATGYLVQTLKAGVKRLLTETQHALLDHESLPGVLSSTEHDARDHEGLSSVLSPTEHTAIDHFASGASMGGAVDMNSNNITEVNALELDNRATNPSASDGPDDYPEGDSYNVLSSASGWPFTTGIVRTFIDTSNARGYQIVYFNTVSFRFIRYRSGATTWSNWHLMDTVFDSSESATQHDITTANTYETARTLTISNLPTSSFSAAVLAEARCWGVNGTATASHRAIVGISLDGGSSWTNGLKHLGETQTGTGHRYAPLAPHARANGAVTGTIQARLQVQSNHADSAFDDLQIKTWVAGNF